MKKRKKFSIALLPGDGIGPEVLAEARKVLDQIACRFALQLDYRPAWIGGAAIERTGCPLPAATWEICRSADAVLLGAVGGPQWDHLEPDRRPELGGLLALRRRLGLYANLRPVRFYPELREASPLTWRETTAATDLLVVRELSSGIYFGQPHGLTEDEAFDTMRYRRSEIERIAHSAFQAASSRRRQVTSVDKANVLATSMLWRRIVTEVATGYPEIVLRHMYVDNAAMQLVLAPSQFDVILTENLFGDILSDESAALAGSLGLLPSASFGAAVHLYEPAGGSAPDIAGRQIANPLAQILSAALLLEHSLFQPEAAAAIRLAVSRAIAAGYRTADIAPPGTPAVSTAVMGDAVVAALAIPDETPPGIVLLPGPGVNERGPATSGPGVT